MDPEELIWLFDSVMQFLKGPEWAMPVWDFIDENCVVFDSEEEEKLAYMDIFNAFREMVDGLLSMHLAEMGQPVEAFAQLCQQYGGTDVGREVLEQVCTRRRAAGACSGQLPRFPPAEPACERFAGTRGR